MRNGTEQKRPDRGHIFWGAVFVALGTFELFQRTMVISGIPVWALGFLSIGIANLLRSERVLDLARIGRDRAPIAAGVATVLNILGIATLAVTFIMGLISR